MDGAQAIDQYLKQMGVHKYSIRPLNMLIKHNTILPAGKYYYLNFAELPDFAVNANNTMWRSATGMSYTLAYQSPILKDQVHFIADDPADTQRVTIIEITPFYEN